MARAKKIKLENSQEIKAEAPAPTKENIFDSDGELVVDVFETPAEFVVLATIAGVNISDLDIAVEQDMMVIKGNRKNPHDGPAPKYFYQECYFGPFSRKIILPESLQTEADSAEMDKGLLTIKIPKMTNNVEAV